MVAQQKTKRKLKTVNQGGAEKIIIKLLVQMIPMPGVLCKQTKSSLCKKKEKEQTTINQGSAAKNSN